MQNAIISIISICIALTAGADLFAQDSLNIEQVGCIYNQWCSVMDVAVVSNLAYVTAGVSGLQIVDVSNPENPEIVGYWDDNPERTWGVTVSGDYAYIANGESGLHVISVADPDFPYQVGYYDTPGFAQDVTVSGNYAYVTDNSSGLRIISIADPEHPEEEGYCDTPSDYTNGVTVSSDYAYVADEWYGLRIISIADPENPEEVGYYDTPGYAVDIALSEDGLIYVADWTNVGIYRFTDPDKVDDSFILHPSAFILYSAYPNPFNSTTTIRFSLVNPGPTRLEVYDLQGRRIRDLTPVGWMEAGNYSVAWNATEEPSGMYLIRLINGGLSTTQWITAQK